MTFKEYVAALAKELGAEIESEGDACAFSLGSFAPKRVIRAKNNKPETKRTTKWASSTRTST